MLRTAGRLLLLVTAISIASTGAFGYYFYVHFASRASFANPIPEKFDLNALRNKTLQAFVSDSGPSQLATADSFTGLISQIRLAVKTWNDVESSDLRLAFGGVNPIGAAQNTPGIDVVFDDDIPPGIIAYGGPMVCTGQTGSSCPVTASGTPSAFVAIQRSSVRIRRDLRELPSYGEDSFNNLVHEFGHALGLQHTLTASAMSTAITRATTKAKPLAADDIAGLSVLYPSNGFLARSGSISGRVTLGGAGVNLASVVAIAASGPAVSALTNPDGTYTIQGIPAGQSYYVYVHPLPPPTAAESRPAGILPPRDQDGLELPQAGYFDTVFYPNTKDPNQATLLALAPGETRAGVNFTVVRRTAPAISSVTTFGYYDSTAVHPAPLLASGTARNIVARGQGLVSGNSPVPGLSVSVLGQAGVTMAGGAPRYYTDGYIYFGLAPTFAATPGPRHLVFAAGGDIYVLPAAILMVSSPPPVITSVTPGTDGGARIATITGTNFDSSTRILFDGAAASVVRRGDNTIVVTPPPAQGGYRASVAALNADGQSSLFVQPTPPAYLYESSDTALINVTPSSLPAGGEAMVEITGINTTFADGQVSLGFGSSDIAVRRLWVTGPNRVLANVSLNAGASLSPSAVTLVSGLQVISQPFGFQPTASNPRQAVVVPPILGQSGSTTGVPAGTVAVMNVSNLSGASGAIVLTVGDLRATILSAINGQITFQVPAALPAGPAIVRLQLPSGEPVYPVVMNIDPPPPLITAAYSSPGVAADSARPALKGFLTGFTVNNIPDPSTLGDFSSLVVNVGGVDHNVVAVLSQNGAALVQILLNPSVPSGLSVPVTISHNGAVSPAYPIPVR